MMKDRIAVVTGANRGIGLEICRQLAQQGVRVVLTSRDTVKGEAARETLAAEGLDVAFHQLDVTDARSIARLATFVTQFYGRLHILVNNAGIYIDNHHALLTLDMDVLQRTLDTNAFGPLMLCQALVPLLRKSGHGRIVNVSSGYGELGNLGSSYPAYSLSKIILNLHTRILADELRSARILVNAMCPGWVRTEMGGPGAPRSIAEGADTAVRLALLPDDGPSGQFFRDRRPISW